MIKQSMKIYETLRQVRPPRLRRSSRLPDIESRYLKNHLIEEHLLYRRAEISNIYNMYVYLKNKPSIIKILQKHCTLFTNLTSTSLLDVWFLGEVSNDNNVDTRRIMLCLLNLKDKKMKKHEIYMEHCTELIDEKKYELLSRI